MRQFDWCLYSEILLDTPLENADALTVAPVAPVLPTPPEGRAMEVS